MDNETRMVLVSVIYFKGLWTHQFSSNKTYRDRFFLNEQDFVVADFMSIKKRFKYKFLPDLEASAIELTYKDSDISMIIILPTSRTGLSLLEGKLNMVNFCDVSKTLQLQELIVKIPKFKIEFDITLNETLKKVKL